jgi:hypothetical protein
MIVPADLLTKMAAIFPTEEKIYNHKLGDLSFRYAVNAQLSKNDLRATVTFTASSHDQLEIFLAYTYFRVSVNNVYQLGNGGINFHRTEEVDQTWRGIVEEALQSLIYWVETQQSKLSFTS